MCLNIVVGVLNDYLFDQHSDVQLGRYQLKQMYLIDFAT